MKVGTPLGEYPFQFRRVERRPDGIAIVGLVAGLESSLVLTGEDLSSTLKRVGPVIAAGLLLVYFRASVAARLRPM
jgi:hypothetical protein